MMTKTEVKKRKTKKILNATKNSNSSKRKKTRTRRITIKIIRKTKRKFEIKRRKNTSTNRTLIFGPKSTLSITVIQITIFRLVFISNQKPLTFTQSLMVSRECVKRSALGPSLFFNSWWEFPALSSESYT